MQTAAMINGNIMGVKSMSISIISVVLTTLSCIVQSQERQNGPFRYPEMYFDYHGCSTIIDWSRSRSDRYVRYDVEFINKDCATRMFSTIEGLHRADYSPGECLADNDCYARVRAKNRDSSLTGYSTWTGLSHKYQMFHGM